MTVDTVKFKDVPPGKIFYMFFPITRSFHKYVKFSKETCEVALKSKEDVPNSFDLTDMVEDFVYGTSDCFIVIKDEGEAKMQATFKHGDHVVVNDEIAKISGVKFVATIDYWIKRDKYKKRNIESKYNYLYFLKGYDGKQIGPYAQEDLEKI